SQSAVKVNKEYRLLLFDGYTSHVNSWFLDYCVENRIVPYCLPPHMTHRLQSLDVSICGPYKHQYQRELNQQFERHEYRVSKNNFYEIFMAAMHTSFILTNIISGFRNTRLIPVKRDIILSKISVPSTIPSS
ncbi:hypothetical protein L873DRAFT_1615576, partial [Choiromyces venosus 120613-1]